MALQSSGAISLADIAGEFGGSTPHSINEYYGADAGVPSSGAIDFADFYGTSAVTNPSGSYWLSRNEYLDSPDVGDTAYTLLATATQNGMSSRAGGYYDASSGTYRVIWQGNMTSTFSGFSNALATTGSGNYYMGSAAGGVIAFGTMTIGGLTHTYATGAGVNAAGAAVHSSASGSSNFSLLVY